MPDDGYLQPTDESMRGVVDFLPDGPFVMLNLFRLREAPDYSKHPDLEPETPTSCRELFYRYIANMDEHLEGVGAKRIFLAEGGPLLIGPDGEKWDVIQTVQYPSKQAFVDLGGNVKDEVPLREVMLVDSRIVPTLEQSLDAVRQAA